MRKKVIAGNWKMHKTLDEATNFVQAVADEIQGKQTEAIICAPFPYLSALVNEAKGSQLKIGAQTMHDEPSGAFTGEVSPVMLNDLKVTHVIIGHSERREYFAETNETVNKKTIAAFKHGLHPIVCVGETLAQREAKETKTHVESQVTAAIQGLTEEQVSTLIIAYEPIWAIGTGMTASTEDANEVCAHIRKVIKEVTSEEAANKITIQYGGSVSPENISTLLAQSDIDGALVGGASLEADSFLQLIKASTT